MSEDHLQLPPNDPITELAHTRGPEWVPSNLKDYVRDIRARGGREARITLSRAKCSTSNYDFDPRQDLDLVHVGKWLAYYHRWGKWSDPIRLRLRWKNPERKNPNQWADRVSLPIHMPPIAMVNERLRELGLMDGLEDPQEDEEITTLLNSDPEGVRMLVEGLMSAFGDRFFGAGGLAEPIATAAADAVHAKVREEEIPAVVELVVGQVIEFLKDNLPAMVDIAVNEQLTLILERQAAILEDEDESPNEEPQTFAPEARE